MSIEPPFGYAEQRELMYLRKVRAKSPHIAAIVAIRTRGTEQGPSRDTLGTLARFGGMSETGMKRAVDWLIERGLLIESKAPKKGGSPGSAWVWTRRVLPYERWPQLASEGTVPTDRLSTGSRSDRTSLDEKSRSETTEEPITDRGRADQTTRDNPEVLPEVLPDDDIEEKTDDVHEKRVRAGLALLQRPSWYPFEEGNDRAMLLAARELSGSELVEEIARWIEKCAGERPEHPRAALRAWLMIAPVVRARRRRDQDILKTRQNLRPRTYEELRSIKAAGDAI